MPKTPRSSSRSGQRAGAQPEAAFRAQLDDAKRASTLQVLFKVARQLDELALGRAGEQAGYRLRRSHTLLLPHIALEGTRMSDLAERLGVSKQAITQLVDELEGFGVVERVPDPDDARVRRVLFTPRGRQALLEGLVTLRDLEEELSRAIGKALMTALREALLAIHDRLEREEPG
jgi:MarR family transcriptional regulator, temperature-dependent positive regulator of motility